MGGDLQDNVHMDSEENNYIRQYELQQHNGTEDEEQRLEKLVTENPANMEAWIEYATYAENKGNAEYTSKIYERLLAEFPLLYGYWNTYAELEQSQAQGQDQEGPNERVLQVYERGVRAVAYSVPLWAQYCLYFAEKSNDLDQIRQLFERAVEVVGWDYQAQVLWDKYIEFELSQEEFLNVTRIYQRIIAIPLRDLDKYWERYKTHIKSRPLNEALTPQDLEAIERESGESGQWSDDQKKDEIIKIHTQTYQNTGAELQKRQPFESSIRRWYFHTQPLDDTQLNSLRAYLDFEEREGNHKRIVKLYERCVVACALYFEFWWRYASYLEKKQMITEAREVLQRSANVLLKRRPEPQIYLAEFEEQYGNVEAARTTFHNLTSNIAKGHLESILRAVAFEMRQSNTEGALQFLQAARDTLDKKSRVFYFIEYATFTAKIQKDMSKAREIFQNAVSEYPSSKILWQAYINMEALHGDEQSISAVFEQCLNTSWNSSDNTAVQDTWKFSESQEIAQQYMEYLLEKSKNISKIREVENKYIRQSCYSNLAKSKGSDLSRKRALDDTTDNRTTKSARTNNGQQHAAAVNPYAAYGSATTPTAMTSGTPSGTPNQPYNYPYNYASSYGQQYQQQYYPQYQQSQ